MHDRKVPPLAVLVFHFFERFLIHEGWQHKLSAWSKKTGAGMNRLAPSEAKVITHCGNLQDYHLLSVD